MTIHTRFFPTPIIPPILVINVFGPICKVENVDSILLSKSMVRDRPELSEVAMNPTRSILYLPRSILLNGGH